MRDRVYLCYSPSDRTWHDRVMTMLEPLLGPRVWSHRRILPGERPAEEARLARQSACVAVCLVSASFLAATDIAAQEVAPLLDDARAGRLTLLWVPVSACLWQASPFADYSPAQPHDQPLDSLTPANRNKALTAIAQAIVAAYNAHQSHEVESAAMPESPVSFGRLREIVLGELPASPAERAVWLSTVLRDVENGDRLLRSIDLTGAPEIAANALLLRLESAGAGSRGSYLAQFAAALAPTLLDAGNRAWLETLAGGAATEMVRLVGDGTRKTPTPIRVLHLSDLHFTADTVPETRLQWLIDDVQKRQKVERLDHLVVSGDFTDKGGPDGFDRARAFLEMLCRRFDLAHERCVFVPGNHDVVDATGVFEVALEKPSGEFEQQGAVFLVRNPATYGNRFRAFSERLWEPFYGTPYPLDDTSQGMVRTFGDTGLQFLTFNSCWKLDRFRRKNSGISPDAIARAIYSADQTPGKLRLGVWHHAVAGPELMNDLSFLGNLQTNQVRVALHGDVHELRREQAGHYHDDRIFVVGAGSFGSPASGMPESTPRLYNLLAIERDHSRVRVYTRAQATPNGAWDGWFVWPNPNGDGRVDYYDIPL